MSSWMLGLRTDKPEAELYLLRDQKVVDSLKWHAHRELSSTLFPMIEKLLKRQTITFTAMTAIIVYQGPGSFTGLRIGISVANALAYALQVPIIGSTGEDWMHRALAKSEADTFSGKPVMPAYGTSPHITTPKK